MRSLLFVLSITLSTFCYAQSHHIITTSGSSWSPSTLNIFTGDTVTWVNSSGTHNVNGTLATFPNNPLGFGNSVGTNWTYTFVFPQATSSVGGYDYKCDVHGSGMSGLINCVEVVGFETELSSIVDYYPNPTNRDITIELDRVYDNISVKLSNINGQLISINEYGSASKIYFEIEEPSGIYFIEVSNEDGEIAKLKVIKK